MGRPVRAFRESGRPPGGLLPLRWAPQERALCATGIRAGQASRAGDTQDSHGTAAGGVGRARRFVFASTTPATVTTPPTRVSGPGRSPSQTQPISTAIGGEK